MRPIDLYLPIVTKNELNDHSHWRSRQRRAKQQNQVVQAALRTLISSPITAPVLVTVTRFAPSSGLDPHDGLPGACKFVCDAVATACGVDDRDPLISFAYAQKRAPYAIRIQIEDRDQLVAGARLECAS